MSQSERKMTMNSNEIKRIVDKLRLEDGLKFGVQEDAATLIESLESSRKELVEALENLLDDTQSEEFILNSSVEKAEQALAKAKALG